MNHVLLGVVLATGGCFEEGGEEHQTLAAQKTAEGFIAFSDISNNVTSDPVNGAAAGEALAKFLATPIAAQALLSPPFQVDATTGFEARVFLDALPAVAPAGLDTCLSTTGTSGCDRFDTVDTCEAGTFTFSGFGQRMCPGCPDNADVFGECTYNWGLNVGFTAPAFSMVFDNTTGSETVTASSISGTSKFPYTLTSPVKALKGNIQVCACGVLTLDEGPPRTLVEGTFVVRDFLKSDLFPDRCALVTFTNNQPSAKKLSCECPNGNDCPL